jgi:hypothetical protein
MSDVIQRVVTYLEQLLRARRAAFTSAMLDALHETLHVSGWDTPAYFDDLADQGELTSAQANTCKFVLSATLLKIDEIRSSLTEEELEILHERLQGCVLDFG